jgi:hypothetical protein
VNRKVSFGTIVKTFGWKELFNGVLPGVVYGVACQMIAKGRNILILLLTFLVAQKYLTDPLVSHAKFEFTTSSRWSWFLALSIAKILLNPVEIAKKKIQTRESTEDLLTTLKEMYSDEGWRGLFKGWALAIPEAFSVVLLTHYTFKGIVNVFGE